MADKLCSKRRPLNGVIFELMTRAIDRSVIINTALSRHRLADLRCSLSPMGYDAAENKLRS